MPVSTWWNYKDFVAVGFDFPCIGSGDSLGRYSLKTEVLLIYNVACIAAVQQSDLAIYIYIWLIYILCIPFHYGLPQDIEYSSLVIYPFCIH